MNIKEVIISLIVEGMRFNQYISSLRKLDVEVYFDLSLMNIVAHLMGIDREMMNDSWVELYVAELSKCEGVPIEPLGKNLHALAEESYESLKNFLLLKYDNGGEVLS